jgi:putative aldouronate transport system permease protein
MIKKNTVGGGIFDIFNVIFMFFVIALTLYPIYYVLVCSFSDADTLLGARGVLLWPKAVSVAAYGAVMGNPNIYSGYRTTLTVVVFGTALSVIMTAVGAFLITRRNFAIRKAMSYMMIFTMYFGGGMIPTYLLVYKWLHLGNTLFSLILPAMISTYNLLIMKANFEALPPGMEEAAKIDGANDILVLFRIVLPLSMPVVAVMILFYGVGYWNSWFSAMMYIRDRSLYPLQLILREILLSSDTGMDTGGGDKYLIGESLKYATIIVATAPILCLYPFIQKYFVKGVMLGAVKG